MALAISTNFAINANTALNAMNKSQSLMGKSISRISTGNRAANPADDPLSYFSGNKIKGDTDGYQALYNGIQDGAARINVADTALSSMIDILTEMKSKAIAYETSSSDADAQTSIKKAYDQLYTSLETFQKTKYKGDDVWSSDLSFTTTLGGSSGTEETTGTGESASSNSGGSVTLPSEITTEASPGASGTDNNGNAVVMANGNLTGKLVVRDKTYDLSSVAITGSKYQTDPGDTYKAIKDGSDEIGAWKYDSDNDEVVIKEIKSDESKFANLGINDITTVASPGASGTDDNGNAVVMASGNATGKLVVGSNTYTLSSDAITSANYTSDLGSGYKAIKNSTTEIGAWKYDSGEDKVVIVSANATVEKNSGGGNFSVPDMDEPTITSVDSSAGISSETVQNLIDTLTNKRVSLGGSLAAMDGISSYLSSMTTANEAAYTAVTEANIAKEMTSYVKNNVYSQAAQAMISQANQSLAQVLNLLQ